MQCPGCLNFYRSTTEYGQVQPDECQRMSEVTNVMEDGNAAEQITIILEAMVFKLSELNNCPFYQSKTPNRRSILDLKESKHGTSTGTR